MNQTGTEQQVCPWVLSDQSNECFAVRCVENCDSSGGLAISIISDAQRVQQHIVASIDRAEQYQKKCKRPKSAKVQEDTQMADQNVTPQKSLESWSFRLFNASGILGCPSLVVSDMLLGWSSMVASGYVWLPVVIPQWEDVGGPIPKTFRSSRGQDPKEQRLHRRQRGEGGSGAAGQDLVPPHHPNHSTVAQC